MNPHIKGEKVVEACGMSEYRALFNQVPAGIYIHDMEGRILDVNEEACQQTGYSRKELLNLRIFDIQIDGSSTPEEEISEQWQQWQPGQRHTIETLHQGRDGTAIPVQVSSSAIKYRGKKMMMVVARDLKELKSAEKSIWHQKNLLETIIDGLPDILAIQKPDHSIVRYNQTGYRTLGMTPAQVRGKKCYHMLGRQTECQVCATREAIQTGKLVELEKYVPELGVYLNCRSNPVKDKTGEVIAVVEQLRDITESKRMEQERLRSEEKFRHLFENAVEGILIIRKNIIEYANPAVEGILGFPIKEIIAKSFWSFIHHEDREKILGYQQMRDENVKQTFDLRVSVSQGSIKWITINSQIINWEGAPATVVFAMDITERKQMEQALSHLATMDDLTGLFNRRMFVQKLDEEISRIKRFGKSAVIVMLDLDHFKAVNDTYGHGIGDTILRKFAALLRSCVRETDTPGRLGGEEFGILLPETTMEAAVPVIRRILENTRESVFATEAGDLHLTISIGYTCFHADETRTDELLARADQALYRAKGNGRDRAEAG